MTIQHCTTCHEITTRPTCSVCRMRVILAATHALIADAERTQALQDAGRVGARQRCGRAVGSVIAGEVTDEISLACYPASISLDNRTV